MSAPPIPPGAVVVEEREISPGVIERRFAYPRGSRGHIRIGGTAGLIDKGAALGGKRGGKRLSAAPALPEIRAHGERVPVELGPDALETISRSLFVDTFLCERETGGYLGGYEEDGVLHISAATKAVDEQWPTSVRLGEEPRDSVGYWHSHPDNRGLEFSSADWRGATERAWCLRTLALVVGRNDGRVLAVVTTHM